MKMFPLLAGLATCISLAEPTFAQPSAGNKAAAEALFDQGKRLLADKNYAQACPKFEASQELDPGLGSLLFLADCYEKSGKTASAWATFKEAQSVAKREQDSKREKVAGVRANALEPLLSKLLVRADATLMSLEGIDIRLNGRPVPKAQWGSEVPVDPGQQRIEVTAPGYERYERSVEVAAGASASTLDIPPLVKIAEVAPPPAPAKAAPPSAPIATVEPRDSNPGSSQKTWGLVLAGTGIVATGVGGFFGLRAIGRNSDSEDICRTATLCDRTGLALRDQARDAAKISTIAFAAGTALLASGVILYFTAADEPATETAHASLFVGAEMDETRTSLKLGGVW